MQFQTRYLLVSCRHIPNSTRHSDDDPFACILSVCHNMDNAFLMPYLPEDDVKKFSKFKPLKSRPRIIVPTKVHVYQQITQVKGVTTNRQKPDMNRWVEQ